MGLWQFKGQRSRNTRATGAQVEYPRRGRRAERVQGDLNHPLGLGTRNKHMAVNAEIERPELLNAGNIRHGLASGATSEYLPEDSPGVRSELGAQPRVHLCFASAYGMGQQHLGVEAWAWNVMLGQEGGRLRQEAGQGKSPGGCCWHGAERFS